MDLPRLPSEIIDGIFLRCGLLFCCQWKRYDLAERLYNPSVHTSEWILNEGFLSILKFIDATGRLDLNQVDIADAGRNMELIYSYLRERGYVLARMSYVKAVRKHKNDLVKMMYRIQPPDEAVSVLNSAIRIGNNELISFFHKEGIICNRMGIECAMTTKRFEFIDMMDEVPYPEYMYEEVFRYACSTSILDAFKYLLETRKEKFLAFIRKNRNEEWIQPFIATVAGILRSRTNQPNI